MAMAVVLAVAAAGILSLVGLLLYVYERDQHVALAQLLDAAEPARRPRPKEGRKARLRELAAGSAPGAGPPPPAAGAPGQPELLQVQVGADGLLDLGLAPGGPNEG